MTNPIRLALQQPALPAYRIPILAALAAQPQIDLQVVYGEVPDLPNAEPSGFSGRMVPMQRLQLPGRVARWHSPQIRLASRRHCDVLMMTWDLNCLSLTPALLKAKMRGVKTILWGHGYSKNEAAWRSIPRRRVAQLATALMFYNHGTAASFAKRGVDPKRLFVAPNSLDQTPIQKARTSWLQSPEKLQDFRERESLGGGPTILYVSRIEPDNRLDLLLEAAAQLKKRHGSLNVIIIGGGEELDNLKRQADGLSLGSTVRFLGPVYGEDQLAPWFITADIFCYPANIGLSILHAFGYGLPVVTSDRVQMQNPEIEALRNGDNGVLYPHDQLEGLVQAIDDLLSDPQRRAAMSLEAERTVREQFNLERMVQGIVEAVAYCTNG